MTHLQVLRLAPHAATEVVDAKPWDAFFLVKEVASAASAGHFSFDYLAAPAQRALLWHCAKAILRRHWAFRGIAEHWDFLAVREQGRTVAAALIFHECTAEAPSQHVATLGYFVVNEEHRRRGLGARLVREIQEHIPAGCRLQCWCTPQSRGMQSLLARNGFTRTHESTTIQIDAANLIVMPSMWVWQRTPVGQRRTHSYIVAAAG
jgi:GNAT superfamily N-acetyltransferase